MICYVDIEHDRALQDEEQRLGHFGRRVEVKYRLEEISGQPCLLQRYTNVTRQRLAEWGVGALIISGNVTDWEHYGDTGLAEMFRIVQAAEIPILGFCGGGQVVVMAHGATTGPMRRLQAGEADQDSTYNPGFFKEKGFLPVRIGAPDPLFDGLGERPVFWHSHYWDIKNVPPGFELLASTDECRIQLVRQAGKPIYGCQFHPEKYTEEYPAGRRLLANFFTLAGITRSVGG
jgi:GMP synthase-like glutamine amidotransferase